VKTELVSHLMVFFTSICFFAGKVEAKEKKLKPEELIAYHLDSIGTAGIRKARHTCKAEGTVRFEVIGDRGLLYGSSIFLSSGKKRRMTMTFGVPDYPGEEIVFNGEEVTVGQILFPFCVGSGG